MSNDATMLGGEGWFGSRHRSLTIKKCENGYEIDAAFSEALTGEQAEKWQQREREVTRRFVFYTEPEVIDFVRQYLATKPDALKEGGPR